MIIKNKSSDFMANENGYHYCKYCGSETQLQQQQQRRMSNPLLMIAFVALASTLLYYLVNMNDVNVGLFRVGKEYNDEVVQLPPIVCAPSNSTTTSSTSSPPPSPPTASVIDTSRLQQELEETSEDDRLERVLKEAATENQTVILTTLNAAWSEPGSMIDVFLESFSIGDGTQELLNHLIIIAMDLKAYGRCKAIHRHCFALIPTNDAEDFSNDEHFMSPNYIKMTWRRIIFLTLVLEKGYNFFFTDADIMWFRNPFPNLHVEKEFQIACDDYNGDPQDLRNYANGGFLYVKASNRTVTFYKHWYSLREKHPSSNDQDVLNQHIKYDLYVREEIGITLWFLHTDYFSDLCQPTKDLGKVCTMHSNCCLLGLDAKLHDLRIMLDDWRTYKERMAEKKKPSERYSWSLLKMKCG